MVFGSVGDGGQGGKVGGGDAGAGHHDETDTGAADQKGNQIAAIPGGRRLAGGQQAVTAEGNYLVEGSERIGGADVEGTVEGDRQRAGGGDQPPHRRKVDGAFRRQRPDDNPRNADRLAIRDIIDHLLQRRFVVDEIRRRETEAFNM